MIYRGNRNGYV